MNPESSPKQDGNLDELNAILKKQEAEHCCAKMDEAVSLMSTIFYDDEIYAFVNRMDEILEMKRIHFCPFCGTEL